MNIVHKDDPRQALIKDVGSLDAIEVFGQYVLIAKYVRPEGVMTRGGVIIPNKALEEDRYQTKVGLVLKLGARAFVDDEQVKFYGLRVDPFDWVAFRPSDGLSMQIGEHECRLVPDVHIKMRLSHPDAVY